MKIIIDTIPHAQQMYDTCGDWRYKDGDLYIYVSDQGDWRKDSLIAIHEMVEALLCKDRDVSEESVSDFDKACLLQEVEGEPGDHEKAPYYAEHQIATIIERMLCHEYKINWQKYEKGLD